MIKKDQQLLNDLLAKADLGILKKNVSISAPLLAWVTIHGNLCLALRHPSNTGESRQGALTFVKKLGTFLVNWGVFTQEQLEAIERVEIEEGSKDF